MNAEEAAAAIASNTEGVYDEVEIEDMEFDEEKKIYTYPCPCGDKFVISEVRPGHSRLCTATDH
jgi:hypothetical protein